MHSCCMPCLQASLSVKLMIAWVRWGGLVATQAAGSWLGGLGSRSTCVCEVSGACPLERSVLDLLSRQLDRCGPEHLCPPCRCEASVGPLAAALVVGICLGAALVGAAWLVACRPALGGAVGRSVAAPAVPAVEWPTVVTPSRRP